MKIKALPVYFIAICIILIFTCAGLFVLFTDLKHKKGASATSSQHSITEQSTWQLGAMTNIDTTTSSGSIKIDNKAGGDYTFDTITCTYQQENASNLADGLTSTSWGGAGGGDNYCTFDLGEVNTINSARINATSNDSYVYTLWGGRIN